MHLDPLQPDPGAERDPSPALLLAHEEITRLHDENQRLRENLQKQTALLENQINRQIEQAYYLRRHKKALKALSSSQEVLEGNVQSVLDKVTRSLTRTLNLSRASVWLLEKDTLFEACVYASEDHLSTQPRRMEQSSHPVFFEAFYKNRVLAVRQVQHDSRVQSLVGDIFMPGSALLTSPFSYSDQIRGCVMIEHANSRDWTPEEEMFCSSVGDFITLTLEADERKRAEQELLRRDRLLQQVVRAVNNLVAIPHFNQAIREVLNSLGKIPDVDRVYLFERPHHLEQQNRLRLLAEWNGEGISPWYSTQVREDGLYHSNLPNWIERLETGQAIRWQINELSEEEAGIMERRDLKSILIMPIEVEGRFWGLIGLDNCHSLRKWSSSEESMLRMVAGALGARVEHQRDEEALGRSESLFRNVFQSASVGIAIIYADGYFAQINPAFAAMLGYSADELLDRSFYDICHPEEHDAQAQRMAQIFSQKLLHFQTENRYLAQDGSLIWANFSASLIHSFEDQPVWLIGIFENITERKRAEEKSRRSERLLNMAGSMAKIGGWEIDIATQQQTWTEEMFNIQGIQDGRMTQSIEDLNQFYPPEAIPQIEAALKNCYEQQQPFELELPFTRRNQEQIWVHIRGAAEVKEGEVATLYGAMQDITERRLNEDALRQLNARLEQRVIERTHELEESLGQLEYAKLEAEAASRAKSEFLANMSHEIRTPMNAILGFTELLNEEIPDRRLRQYLEAISSSGRTLLGLINDILDLSKIEAGKLQIEPVAVNPYRLFREVQGVFGPKIREKEIDFYIEIDPELPAAIVFDEIRMRQVLFNLIGNAVKFTEHGHIKISVAKQPHLSDTQQINLRVAVEDTGIGIPLEDQERIFEAFQQREGQSTRKYGGTGLGLTITRRLVEMMNGELSVTSAPGKGSTFTVTLQGIDIAQNEPAPAEAPSAQRQVKFKAARILIADDISLNRVLIRTYFEASALQFSEAENGLEALEMAREERPDLILMDLKMPIMDGYEATLQLRQSARTADIPVIALTASGMKQDEALILQRGFNGYLRKPVLKQDLVQELARFLPHEQAPSSAVTPAEASQAYLATADDRQAAYSALQQLQEDWEKVHDSLILDEIEAFAHQLTEIGQTFHQNAVRHLAQELLDTCGNFEMDRIPLLMNRFPHLVQALAKENTHEG
ncbi:MAG: ATP-binding protein [Candidatus Sericytochromatia bacterium]